MSFLIESHEFVGIERSTITTTEIVGISSSNLTALSKEQRLGFEITVGSLCVLSLCGNLSTLYVNSRRKMRPFFRACLISLALSDLLSTIFLTLTHFPQFTAEYVQIWRLGPFMCRFIPMVTTAAILASSLTLVGIALDRYFAVMKAVITFWNPGVGFCILFALGVWLVSLGIATPVCFVFHTVSFYLLNEADYLDDDDDGSDGDGLTDTSHGQNYTLSDFLEPITMCLSDQRDVAMYYVIVFSIIFVPCILAFVWLNSIIARTIWTRRHRPPPPPPPPPPQNQEETKRSSNKRSIKSKSAVYNSAREARHIRMFVVIVVLMAVFIILRLPAWIFTVMRTYGTYAKPHDWIIFFTFAVLNLTSCALNPLFYTFLPETLQYIACCKRQFCTNKNENESDMRATTKDILNPCCICCCSCLWRPRWLKKCGCSCKEKAFPATTAKDKKIPKKSSSLERDEGVDCESEKSRDEGAPNDHDARNYEICIVFSSTFVSSYSQQRSQLHESYSEN